MPAIEEFFDAIDAARVQRAKELSEIKRTFSAVSYADPLGVASKSVIVLSYAAWEGFYNDCTKTYLDFLSAKGLKVSDAGWLLLIGAMSSDFVRLRDRHHSPAARREFIESLKERLICDFSGFDRSVVMARSNLDFAKLSENFTLLDLDIQPFQPKRIRLDKELVGWRHGVAHGDPPDLSAISVDDHISFTSNLLLSIADTFQIAILKRA